MTKKEMFVKAHKMAKEIKKEYQEVNYKVQFGLCLAYLKEEGAEEVEKKITWEDVANQAEKVAYEEGYTDYYVNNWKKGGHDRSYLELRWYRNGRCKEIKKCGYWDNNKEEYVVESKYQKNYNIFDL